MALNFFKIFRTNPRFRSKHKRTHRNYFGLWPQQQQKIERQTLKKMGGIR